jgi:hypothetical protein
VFAACRPTESPSGTTLARVAAALTSPPTRRPLGVLELIEPTSIRAAAVASRSTLSSGSRGIGSMTSELVPLLPLYFLPR